MALRYIEIRDQIAEKIDRGEFLAGEQIDSEVRLAESFQVSRPTVRQALEMLEQDGYIVRTHGRGTFVRQRSGEETKPPTRLVHFVAPNLARPFVGRLLAGAEAELTSRGWHLSVTSTGDSIEGEAEVLEKVAADRSTGILIQPTNAPYYNPALVGVVAQGLPLVMLARHYQFVDCSFVEGDNYGGARQAVAYLVSKGHTQIGVVTKPFGIKSSMANRIRGYRDALGEAGIPYRPDLVLNTLNDPRSVYENAFDEGIRENVVKQIADFLEATPTLTALIAFNELIANDAAIAAGRLGRNPHRDMAIVGFDDVDVGFPREHVIASVRVPVFEIGRQGARALLHRLEHPESERIKITLPTELSFRENREERLPADAERRHSGKGN